MQHLRQLRSLHSWLRPAQPKGSADDHHQPAWSQHLHRAGFIEYRKPNKLFLTTSLRGYHQPRATSSHIPMSLSNC
jgi:hypothetical protein